MQVDDHTIRRPVRQDTYDLRGNLIPDNGLSHDISYPSDEEHSVLEDDSDTEEKYDDVEDDDGSSSLSIPNESIDFDLVYALHSFAATVEGQANVVKGDSLFLMDDSNSYWWLVRVLKTQEVGYIPAENIETPFERLARLNKHRNVDLASATQAEFLSSQAESNQATPSPTPGTRSGAHGVQRRGVSFTPALSVHRYPPAVWGDEEEEDEDVEWDDEGYEDEDPELAEEQEIEREREKLTLPGGSPLNMEPDDGMSWEDGAVEAQPGRKGPAAVAVEPSVERQQRELSGATPLRSQGSREQLNDGAGSSPVKMMDPAQVTETRKLSMTPPVARAEEQKLGQPVLSATGVAQGSAGPLLPSAIMQQHHDERKRTREEIEALEEASRKRANTSAVNSAAPTKGKSSGDQSQRSSGGGKLRKDREPVASTDDEGGKDKDKKKKSGVFGRLFAPKKEKGKDKEKGSESGSETNLSRVSEDSGRSSSQQHTIIVEPGSPVTNNARQQQQQAILQQQGHVRNLSDSKRMAPQQQQSISPLGQQQQQSTLQPAQTSAPPSVIQAQLSQHASQLRQRDQQQQALYQQYLNRSPSSPPEAQPSYGLQSASAIMGSTSFSSSTSSTSVQGAGSSRPRPGSLVLSPNAMEGQGVGLPDLSVIRVFAGHNLQTEATFKTVLLNASTTASDLVRQAIQRFRLPAGEDAKDYYLTIKQVEGSSAALLPQEKPLGVFETLVEAALELPKVKRSSVGSISSVASNLSMHPAIKKLPMNDFTDDSAVKFYLNRRNDGGDDPDAEQGDETLLAESTFDEDIETTPRGKAQFLSVSTAATSSSVTPERFSSPSFRFALQLIIFPDDLPDDMVFDPLTEAIVFKNTLRDRSQSNIGVSPGISQSQRRKVFVFPKNITVAEVIEIGLERFGILEGVVDGGDEVEDKLTKRRSSSRVRYGLTIDLAGRERELSPSSRVIDAFPRPPTYRAVDRRFTDNKRRSVDSAQLLGSLEDIHPEDPMFILRRAVAYRTSSSRHRSSAPLDEIALQQLHRNSIASSSASDSTTGPSDDAKHRQLSKQEIIAAQRAATRANQRAILTAQVNSARGLDLLLPGNAMIRSSRYEVDDRIRYSYVEPDGETYDISDIVEEEWRSEVGQQREIPGATRDDLLQGVLDRGKDGLGAKLERVLSKIKHEKGTGRQVTASDPQQARVRSVSPSDYSTAESGPERNDSRSPTMNRSPTPTSASVAARAISPLSRLSSYRTASPGGVDANGRSRTVTPTAQRPGVIPPHNRQYSIASIMSDTSVYQNATAGNARSALEKSRLIIPKDDFGFTHMMNIIEVKATRYKKPELPPLDPVDELLFGRQFDIESLHPRIKDVYSTTFKQLDEMDKALDDLLQHAIHAF